MDAKLLALNFLIYTFELFIFYDYASRVFEKRCKKSAVWLGMTAGHILLYLSYCFGAPFFINLFLLLSVNALMFYLLYNSTLLQALFHSVILIVLMTIAETVSISTIAAFSGEYTYSYGDDWGLYFTSCVIGKMIYFVFCKTVSSFAIKNNREKYGKELLLILIFPMATLFVLYTFYIFAINPHKSINVIFLICSTVLFAANFMIFLVYDHITEESNAVTQMKIEKQSKELDNQYLEYINQKQTDYRVFMHDIKNHLEIMKNLTDDSEIRKYIDSIYENAKLLDSYYNTGNKALNLILSKYATLFKSENIAFETFINSSELNFINDTDFSTYLNNLFNNSFEAAAKSKERRVIFSISVTDSAYIISLDNSCDIPPSQHRGKLITAKSDKSLHGFGTKSIDNIVKKYGGSNEWSYDSEAKFFRFATVFQVNKNKKAC